jgi:hypothetical protein
MATKRPKMKTLRPTKRPVAKASGRKAARAKGAAAKRTTLDSTARPAPPVAEAAKEPAPVRRVIEKKPGSLPVPTATFYF